MQNLFQAKIISTEPGAVYQGNVYDQSVTLELKNKQRVSFFNYSITIEKDLIGKDMRFTATMLASKFLENNEKKKELIQTSKNTATLNGEIIEIKKDKQKTIAILDTGSAKFNFYPDSNQKLKKEDYIKVENTRIDLFLKPSTKQ